MQRFYSYNSYMRQKFGCKMYKLSLSISNTCPNRDGKKGCGGCIFCSEGGSGDFAAAYCKSVSEQIKDAKRLVSHKNRGGKYVAYFQSFTSTYIEPKKLRDALADAIAEEDVAAISISTRADCLGDEILTVLGEFCGKIPITVEMGLQTVHDKTAKLINRCCELKEYETSLKKLKALGIEVVYHIIAGLPFESEADFLQTVRYVGKSGADGIKIQLLHVLKGTELAKLYERDEFEALSKEEYFSLVARALEILPPDMVIHRLTGDGAKKLLVAPLWSADKKDVLNSLNHYLEENNIIQGKKISDAL